MKYYLEYCLSANGVCYSYCRSFDDLKECFQYYNLVKDIDTNLAKRVNSKTGEIMKELVYIEVYKAKNCELLMREDF